MDKKFIAVGLVVILVIAGAAAVFLVGGNDDTDDVPLNLEGRLMIYGNATNDDYLNSDDVDFIQSIVDGKASWDKASNPYADANNDGSVTAADVDFVKKMVDREPMKIWYRDGQLQAKQIDYPLNNIVVIGITHLFTVQYLDVLDRVKAISGTGLSFDKTVHKTLDKLPRISDSSTKIDISLYSEVAQNTPGGIDAVLSDTWTMKSQEAALEEAEITVVRMDSDTFDGEFRSCLTFGYLMGAEKRSLEVVGFLDEQSKKINDKISTIPEADKKSSVVISSNAITFWGGNMCSNKGATPDKALVAGTVINVTEEDLGGAKKAIWPGDVWQLSDKFQSDFFIEMVTGFGYNSSVDDFAHYWERIFKADELSLTKMDCYPDGFLVISRDLPGIVTVSYFVEYFYPELFEEGFADEIHQQWVDNFFPDLEGYDVSKNIFLCSADDMKGVIEV